jgi:hypothetical protein
MDAAYLRRLVAELYRLQEHPYLLKKGTGMNTVYWLSSDIPIEEISSWYQAAREYNAEYGEDGDYAEGNEDGDDTEDPELDEAATDRTHIATMVGTALPATEDGKLQQNDVHLLAKEPAPTPKIAAVKKPFVYADM